MARKALIAVLVLFVLAAWCVSGSDASDILNASGGSAYRCSGWQGTCTP